MEQVAVIWDEAGFVVAKVHFYNVTRDYAFDKAQKMAKSLGGGHTFHIDKFDLIRKGA